MWEVLQKLEHDTARTPTTPHWRVHVLHSARCATKCKSLFVKEPTSRVLIKGEKMQQRRWKSSIKKGTVQNLCFVSVCQTLAYIHSRSMNVDTLLSAVLLIRLNSFPFLYGNESLIKDLIASFAPCGSHDWMVMWIQTGNTSRTLGNAALQSNNEDSRRKHHIAIFKLWLIKTSPLSLQCVP